MSYLRRDDDHTVHYELSKASARVGRDRANDIVLPTDMRISRHHARFMLDDGQWTITDDSSANGTFVNDRRVSVHALRNGDRIRLGNTTMIFVAVADPQATFTGADADDDAAPALSARELDVLLLLAEGRTDKEIAKALTISIATVRSHLDRIREKTGCRRRAELTRLALDLRKSP